MDQLIRMAIRMLMRQGMRRVAKGQKKPQSNNKTAQKGIRAFNKIRRM